MKLFELYGAILIENDKANASIDKTDSKVGGLISSIGGIAKGAAVMGAAVVAGVGAAATGLFKMTENAAAAGDRVDKLSQKIGLSRQAFQEWDYVLSQNGIQVERLQTGVKTMTDAMGGVGAGAKAFQALGIAVTDASGAMRSQEEVFAETVSKLQGMEDQTLKASLATDLFGKAGTELMPLLNQTAEGTANLTQRAHELGLVMSDEAVNASVVFSDSMDDVKRSLGAIVAQIGVAVMPIFQEMLNWILANMPVIRETFSVVFGVIKTVVETAINVFKTYLLPIFVQLFDWVQANWPAIKDTIKQAFDTIMPLVAELWKLFSEHLLPAMKALWDWVSPWMPKLGGVIFDAFTTVVNIAKDVVSWVNRVIDTVKTAIDWLSKFASKSKDTGGGSGGFGTGGTVSLSPYINGSHAGGLDYVPYDGYVAELHKGERVLTADEARRQSSISTPSNKTGVITFEKGAFDGAIIMDDYGVDRLMDRIVNRLGALGVV